MFRTTMRLISVLVVLASLPLSLPAARAQTQPNDLKPKVADLATNAFTPSTTGVSAANSQVLETAPIAAAPFTDIMVRWQSTEPAFSTIKIEVRASNDGSDWTPWGEAYKSEEPDVTSGGEDAKWSGAIYAGQSRFYQLRATLTPGTGGQMPTLDNVQVHTVDTRIAPGALSMQASGGEVSARGIARPSFLSRTAWGNPQGESAPNAPPAYYTANHLVVHHTADANTLRSGESDWAARVRAIWSFHTYTRGWGDIGYNWLIDPNGVIYAGRAGSTDLNRDAVGFHDTANYGSMGVVMIGTYTDVTPTGAAQNSLVDILAWKADQRNIDPMGSSWYYGCSRSSYCAPFNANSVVVNIAGHRQVTPGHTTCPGDKGMEILTSVRQRVLERLRGTTDNGDAIIDELEPGFTSTGGWHVKQCGYAAHTRWTYATNTQSQSTNSGTWRPNLSKSGQYKVLVHIPQGCAIAKPPYATTNPRYKVHHANGVTEAVVDHNTAQTWVELGTFTFNAGTSGAVTLNDMTNEPYYGDPNRDKVIFFDAVQWVYQQPVVTADARLRSATPKATTISVGDVLPVEFEVQNTGTSQMATQEPEGGNPNDGATGWAYDEGECFVGNGDAAPSFPKVPGSLRVTLGVTNGPAVTSCGTDDSGYPWRWGLDTPVASGETRRVVGYVRFRTPGTYTLRANLIGENVKWYGTDGSGGAISVGPIVVRPEQRPPETTSVNGGFTPDADVYRLTRMPNSLLARTSNALSIPEGDWVGSFPWNGAPRQWGGGGPAGQSDYFIVRQTRTFVAPVAGTYKFRITSDDGSWLWIDGKLVVGNEGLHTAAEKEGSIYLGSGPHVLAVKFFENTGEAFVGYDWMQPGSTTYGLVPVEPGAAHVGSTFRTGQQFVISGDDLGGSGVHVIRYWVDGGAMQETTERRVPFSLGTGRHTIQYETEDYQGNRSRRKTVTLYVDPNLRVYRTFGPQLSW